MILSLPVTTSTTEVMFLALFICWSFCLTW